MGNLRFATDLLKNEFGQLEHGELTWVAKVHGADNLLLLHEAHESVDEIVNKAEGSGLGTLAVNSKIPTLEGLNDEVGDHSSIIGEHARTIGVENADHSDIDAILAVIVEEECLGSTLPLVIAGSEADGVDMAPVRLGLGMNIGIAVHLGGGGLEDACIDPLGKAEAVDGPDHGGFHGLDGIVLVVRRRSRAGKIVDAVHLELEWVDHIMANKFEAGIPQKMVDIGLASGEEIIETDDFMPLLDETIAKMGTEKSGSAGDEDTHM